MNGPERDQIFLEGMIFYGYHGVHAEEQRLGQRFVIDLHVDCDLEAAGRSDDPADTVSYSDLFRVTRAIVEGPPRQLIEAVAESIATAILDQFAPVERVVVTVRKPEAPIKGSVLESAGVTIVRRRAA
ncbi:MAG TPA: dihydroneopterin aldolase [Nitrolancea sp.]|jgi:dihydroneopterin aldolase|nr:dihydroneopterin aldolase [Nitrolancea sp.]